MTAPDGPVTVGCVGDVHGRIDRVEKAGAWLAEREPDLVAVAGDFGVGAGRGSADALEATLAALEPLGVPVLWVPGNHDPRELDGPGSADRRRVEAAGLTVFGLGGSTPTPARLPYEWTDDELADLDPPPCDLLLCHDPPAETSLDVTVGGRHVGSRTVRRWAEADAAPVLVCGHIHEAAGAEVVGSTLCYNAGSLGAPRGALQAGLLAREADGAWEVRHRLLEAGEGWTARREAPPGD